MALTSQSRGSNECERWQHGTTILRLASASCDVNCAPLIFIQVEERAKESTAATIIDGLKECHMKHKSLLNALDYHMVP